MRCRFGVPGGWKLRWWMERETSVLALSCEKWLAFRDVCWHMFSHYSWKNGSLKEFKESLGLLPFVCWTLCCPDFRRATWLVLVVCIGFFIFEVLNYCPEWDPQTPDFIKRLLRAFAVYVPSNFFSVVHNSRYLSAVIFCRETCCSCRKSGLPLVQFPHSLPCCNTPNSFFFWDLPSHAFGN